MHRKHNWSGMYRRSASLGAVMLAAILSACSGDGTSAPPKTDPAVSAAQNSPALDATIARLKESGWEVASFEAAEVERYKAPVSSTFGEEQDSTRVILGAENTARRGTSVNVEFTMSPRDGEVVSVGPGTDDSASLLWDLQQNAYHLDLSAALVGNSAPKPKPSAKADAIVGVIKNLSPNTVDVQRSPVAGEVHSASPGTVDAQRSPVLRMNAGRLLAVVTGVSASTPSGKDSTHLLQAGSTRTRELAVALPISGTTSPAELAQDGTVVYADDEQALTLAVQDLGNSVRILEVLAGENAPSEYEFPVSLPPGGTLKKAEHGGILVLDANGVLLGGFAPPWAVDSGRQSLPTRFEIRGNSVVQIIEHVGRTVQYPVVADPWLFVDLIDHATWRWTSGSGWTLQVTPTWWARANAPGYLVGVAGWDELYAKYRNRGLNTNLGGMRDQFICHQQFAFAKSTWNLDEWRPDVSYAKTVACACNP